MARSRNESARPIRKWLPARGYCPNCAITEFILGTPSMSQIVSGSMSPKPPGMDAALYERMAADERQRASQFPEAFRLPHIQEAFASMLRVGECEAVEEIDWDEVIANWDLPFPRKMVGYG